MKKNLFLLTLFIFFIACSKPISINDLESADGLAVDPTTNEPYTGLASLDFYNGGTRMIGEYKSGLKSGDWKYYVQNAKDKYYDLTFDNGNIILAKYNDSDRQWQGTPVAHKPDSLMGDGSYLVQEQDIYNYNMSPTVYVQLINSNPHGNLTRWFPEGQMFSDGSFINGNRQGQFTWWYKSGALKETSFWENGNQIGKTTQYWENGNNYAVANYVKNVLTGKLTWWYEDGQKKEEVNFVEGERDGLAYWWYPDGNKKAIADVSSMLGQVTMFSADGSHFERFNVQNNKVFCKSGEILFSIENISKDSILPINDGTCDCADCSDESS